MTDLPAYLRPFVLDVAGRPDQASTASVSWTSTARPSTAPDGCDPLGPRGSRACRSRGDASGLAGLPGLCDGGRSAWAWWPSVVDHSLIRGLDQLFAAADEVEAAVGVLRADPQVDPERVVLWFFSGAGLLAGEWLDSRPDWLRFVALTYPCLATPPGVDELVSAAEVIGKQSKRPAGAADQGRPRARGARRTGSGVRLRGWRRAGHHRRTERATRLRHARPHRRIPRRGDQGSGLGDRPPGRRTRRPAPHPRPPPGPTTDPLPPRRPRPVAGRKRQRRTSRPPPSTVAWSRAAQHGPPLRPADVAAAAREQPSGGDSRAVPREPAGRRRRHARLAVVGREHSAYEAHDLEAFLAMYSPTARIQMADGPVLRGRRSLREYYRPGSRPASARPSSSSG